MVVLVLVWLALLHLLFVDCSYRAIGTEITVLCCTSVAYSFYLTLLREKSYKKGSGRKEYKTLFTVVISYLAIFP